MNFCVFFKLCLFLYFLAFFDSLLEATKKKKKKNSVILQVIFLDGKGANGSLQ